MSSPSSELRPLDLTVHSTPSVQQLAASLQQASPPQRTRYGRWKMLAVLAVCAAPVVASYFTYYVIRPEGRRNFGTLIEPQRPMPATLMARNGAGQEVPLASLRDQWLLVSASGGDCDTGCEQQLYLQRQLRESLGREKDRLDWVWLVTDAQPPAARLQSALAQAQVLQVAPDALHGWLEPAPGKMLSDHLYVVDPLGNWMLRFPAHMGEADAGQAKRDLERLLRASSSWDQPGR